MQASHVLLQALSAHACLRDAASVLRSSRQLEDLASNDAVSAAEGLAVQLSALAVALEWPALGPVLPAVEYDQCKGTAGVMPLLQVIIGSICSVFLRFQCCDRQVHAALKHCMSGMLGTVHCAFLDP